MKKASTGTKMAGVRNECCIHTVLAHQLLSYQPAVAFQCIIVLFSHTGVVKVKIIVYIIRTRVCVASSIVSIPWLACNVMLPVNVTAVWRINLRCTVYSSYTLGLLTDIHDVFLIGFQRG